MSDEKSREVLKELLKSNLPESDKFAYPVLVRIRLRHEARLLLTKVSSSNTIGHMYNIIEDIVNKQSDIDVNSLEIYCGFLGK